MYALTGHVRILQSYKKFIDYQIQRGHCYLLWQSYGIYTMSKCRSMKVTQQMNNRMPIKKNG